MSLPPASCSARANAIPDRVEIWDIARLIPSARHARTHSLEQIAEIARSIETYGFMTRVLVDVDGLIIAGHARVLAARELRLERIPVVVIDHLSEAEKRACAIADNQIALHAGWDDSLLQIELAALQAEGIDLTTVGFSEDELERLARQVETETGSDDEAVPEALPQTITRTGDVWRMGPHRLLCGDATESGTYTQLLDAPAQMVFTDPPYNVSYRAPGSGVMIKNDNLGSHFGAFLRTACAEMLRHTNGAVYMCMSSSELHTLQRAFTEAGGHWSTFLIWAKSSFTLGRSDYQRQYEPILYGWREGGPHYWRGVRDQSDLWFFDKPHVNDLHPTMKPVALIEQALWNSSRRGDRVLDPFAGSGSSLIACQKTGRIGRLMELEPAYCDVILQRWQRFTRKEAVLEQAGQTFAQRAGQVLGGVTPALPVNAERVPSMEAIAEAA